MTDEDWLSLYWSVRLLRDLGIQPDGEDAFETFWWGFLYAQAQEFDVLPIYIVPLNPHPLTEFLK